MTFLQWIRSVNKENPRTYKDKNKFRDLEMGSRLVHILGIAERMGENPDYKKECRFLIDEIRKIKE